jgi:hypothetical protein
MSSGENPNLSDRVELCQQLAPRIISAVEAFFDPAQPHPYLEGIANGGHITSHPERDTEDTEYLTIMEAVGFRDTLAPERFEDIDIPEEIAANGLMWVLMKKEAEYEKDRANSPGERKWDSVSHAFAYWNGSQWHASRLKEGVERSADWETKWENSELTEEETEAIKAVVRQTQDIHRIAEVFDGSEYAFEDMVLEFPRDLHNLIVLSRGLHLAFNTPRHGGTLPYNSLPTYMYYYGTGYQRTDLIRVAHSLATHNSFGLDSGGIMAAQYHTSSMPPTSEVLEKGLNIPLRNMHPPVPADFLEQ